MLTDMKEASPPVSFSPIQSGHSYRIASTKDSNMSIDTDFIEGDQVSEAVLWRKVPYCCECANDEIKCVGRNLLMGCRLWARQGESIIQVCISTDQPRYCVFNDEAHNRQGPFWFPLQVHHQLPFLQAQGVLDAILDTNVCQHSLGEYALGNIGIRASMIRHTGTEITTVSLHSKPSCHPHRPSSIDIISDMQEHMYLKVTDTKTARNVVTVEPC